MEDEEADVAETEELIHNSFPKKDEEADWGEMEGMVHYSCPMVEEVDKNRVEEQVRDSPQMKEADEAEMVGPIGD